MSRWARPLAAVTTIAGVAVALHALGDGDLAPPPLTDLDAFTGWYEARDTAATAIALVRFAAELSAWYVLGLTALHRLASFVGTRGLAQIADALTLPGIRSLVRATLGLGLLAATAAGADEAGPGTATMRPIPSDVHRHDDASDGATDEDPAGTARMVPVGDELDRDRPDGGPDADDPVPPAVPTTWMVDEGESFWTIAEEIVARHVGRPPTDAEVDRVWRSLIDRNRGRLVEPGNPDLILPGQVFDVAALAVPAVADQS